MLIELAYESPGAAARQRLEDAALALQLARARRIREGLPDEDEVLEGDLAPIQRRIRDECARSREILAVSQRTPTVAQFLEAHRLNRRLARDGVRQLGCFETRNMTQEMLEFLAAADDMPYYCCFAPVQVKVLDRRLVMVDGPLRDGLGTVLLTESPELVKAALSYVCHVRDTAIPARAYLERQQASRAGGASDRPLLTDRQRLVAELLDGGATDSEIAAELSLSVRTVRYEVAAIIAALGAQNRFGAGRRYAEMSS